MKTEAGALHAALSQPESMLSASETLWNTLIPLARDAGLLARLRHRLPDDDRTDRIPERIRLHLDSARAISDKHANSVIWEIKQIRAALSELKLPVTLLKGAAYVAAGLPPGRGRIFVDIDILVPKDRLDDVEGALRLHGWSGIGLSPYDERYYRRWMHQLPPLIHERRETVIDVHHTIVPPTAAPEVDETLLLRDARPVEGLDDVQVLSPADMVLHSATHLFDEGESPFALRDLVDLQDLMRHFGQEPNFWTALVSRAEVLDLRRPLYYALRYTQRLLGSAIPAQASDAVSGWGPGPSALRIMDAMFTRVLQPDHPICKDALTGPMVFLLYVRGHYLRMPPHLLLPHLARKTVSGQIQRLESFVRRSEEA